MSNYSAVVLCAGSGSRSGLVYNKVLYQSEGKPLFVHAVESFLSDEKCSQIIVVTKESEREYFTSHLDALNRIEIEYVNGGMERSDSVENALNAINQELVLIHDAARGRVDVDDLKKLCRSLLSVDAVLLGLPIVDTVKRVHNNRVIGTEDRETLYLAQTPQGFHTEMLKDLIKKAKLDKYLITDEIMLVERYLKNGTIEMLNGSKKYLKRTYSEDFGR